LYAQTTEMIQGVEILREGEPLGSFYGLIFDGVVQKNEDVFLLPSTPSYGILQPGDPKFRDVSGGNGEPDNHISGAYDRVVLGSKQPDFTYGFSTTFHYKGFDFYASLQGSQGNKVYNLLRRYLERPTDAYNISATLLNSWTESNPSNTVPRIVSSPLSSELDSRYVEDASYLRLKTVTLGYTIDKFPFVSSGTPMKIRLFATAQNLFTLSGYKGYDPEISGGIDLGTYPMARTFYIGANVSF
ncbi:TonB-dependent receptor SusC, partial [termite gut metagenome]